MENIEENKVKKITQLIFILYEIYYMCFLLVYLHAIAQHYI